MRRWRHALRAGLSRPCRRGPEALSQSDKTGIRRLESAGSEIEVAQVWIEIHMKPLATGFPSVADRLRDQFSRMAAAPQRRGNHRIEQEGMHAAVPGHVDEARKATRDAHAHPPEAVP